MAKFIQLHQEDKPILIEIDSISAVLYGYKENGKRSTLIVLKDGALPFVDEPIEVVVSQVKLLS